MVQMDFLAANHVRIVGLCGHPHRVVIFAIAQLSCYIYAEVTSQLTWTPTSLSSTDDDDGGSVKLVSITSLRRRLLLAGRPRKDELRRL